MRYKLLILILLTIILVGCYPKSLKYNLGISTRSIQGYINEKGGKHLKSESFIVIVEYFSRFIKFENESPIYVPKARLIFPNKKGEYLINFDLKSTSIDLTFIASGYKTHQFFFRRQIGVGNLHYDVELVESKSWENEFFVQTRPFLENFILEQRYEMPDYQQLFLGNWLAEVKKNFTKKG
tara:strand:+ start:1993 stop:2535 length:543 start_codon:yes stop_codon:yes gene_type:complete